MRITGAEGAEFAPRCEVSAPIWTKLLENSSHYHKCARRCPVVMESRRLSRQPADYPEVIVRAVVDSLVPLPIATQSHPSYPIIGRCRDLYNSGQFSECWQNDIGQVSFC